MARALKNKRLKETSLRLHWVGSLCCIWRTKTHGNADPSRWFAIGWSAAQARVKFGKRSDGTREAEAKTTRVLKRLFLFCTVCSVRNRLYKRGEVKLRIISPKDLDIWRALFPFRKIIFSGLAWHPLDNSSSPLASACGYVLGLRGYHQGFSLVQTCNNNNQWLQELITYSRLKAFSFLFFLTVLLSYIDDATTYKFEVDMQGLYVHVPTVL